MITVAAFAVASWWVGDQSNKWVRDIVSARRGGKLVRLGPSDLLIISAGSIAVGGVVGGLLSVAFGGVSDPEACHESAAAPGPPTVADCCPTCGRHDVELDRAASARCPACGTGQV
jgi:hypothetical protein